MNQKDKEKFYAEFKNRVANEHKENAKKSLSLKDVDLDMHSLLRNKKKHKTHLAKNLWLTETGSELHITSGIFKHPVLGMFCLIISVVFFNLLSSVFSQDLVSNLIFAFFEFLVFPISIGVLLLGSIWFFLASWFSYTEVTIKCGEIRSTAFLFFIPFYRRHLDNSDFDYFSYLSTNSLKVGGTYQYQYYSIFAYTKKGKRISVADGIKGETNALLLKGYIEKKFNGAKVS